MPVVYDPAQPDLEAVRRILFDWLRANPNANQLNKTGTVYEPFVEYANNNRHPEGDIAKSGVRLFFRRLSYLYSPLLPTLRQ
jgi:hypothetical protein